MILEVGMAPGGKIKKPKEEVEEYLQHFLIIADAMAKNKNWGYLAQYSILGVGGSSFFLLNEYFYELNPRKNPVLNIVFELNPRKKNSFEYFF